MNLLPARVVLCGFALSVTAQGAESKTSMWNGYDQVEFTFENRAALLVRPKVAAEGKPWIWRTEFFGHEPQADIALLAAGWHVAYIKVSDMYGAPPAIEAMATFHDHLAREYGLGTRAVLEGFSRGGLYAVNYAAAHPDHTAAIYVDAPVLDIRSWPGGKGKGPGSPQLWPQCLALYGLTEETVKAFKGNPIDYATALAKAGIPVIAVCGDADEAVPIEENTKIFEDRYRAAGGTIEVILKPGGKHHPH
ncbi:MAG TPA: alpha/beta hydrolase, partial [Chthoniobacteraceae bacterium]|nr:alpha/beta hydrolase [Chthoniobacteraceae bacterium]